MITSRENARVKQVCAYQSKKKERDRDGVFVAEGWRLVSEAPPEALAEVYVSASFRVRASSEEQRFLEQNAAVVTDVSDAVFAKMSAVKTPQGILAVVKRREQDAPGLRQAQPAGALGSLSPSKGPSAPVLILDGIHDSGNLGTIFRSAEAAGVSHILMSADCADIYNPKVVRATMGSIFRIPFSQTEDLPAEIRALRKAPGVRVFAAMLDQQARAYHTIDMTETPVGFVIGNEANGIRAEVAEACDDRVYIPMAGKNESLNAAVSASVLLFEAARQRASCSTP